MTYEAFQEAHSWLFSLVRDPEGKRFSIPKTHTQRQTDMVSGMERSARFLGFAGNPERQVKSVHITGTSGKGSVSNMIAALLRGMGLATALHTSPYLQMPTEKLIFNDQEISYQGFADLVWRFKEIHDAWGADGNPGNRLRYTEAWNALTFLWLANQQPDWGVIEAGMGGRLDPTNLLPSRLAVITNVAYDHVKSLGPKLTDIAHHKAGIIKSYRPAITGVQNRELLSVIEEEASEKGATLYRLGKEFSYTIDAPQVITVQTPFNRYEKVPIGPVGRFQWENAALAITAADTLIAKEGVRGPLNLDPLAELSIPGRMEVVDRNPLTLLDGAHNPHKMRAMITSLREIYPSKKITAIVGGIVNKEISGILKELVPYIDVLIGTAPNVPGKPAVPPGEIAATVGQLPTSKISSIFANDNVTQAVERARSLASKEDLILITGSLYLVGEAREIWYPRSYS